MKRKKQTKEPKKNINVPAVVLLILFLLAMGLGIFFIIKDAGIVNTAYTKLRTDYTNIYN